MMTPAELGIAAACQQAQDIDRYGACIIESSGRWSQVCGAYIASVIVEDAEGRRAIASGIQSLCSLAISEAFDNALAKLTRERLGEVSE